MRILFYKGGIGESSAVFKAYSRLEAMFALAGAKCVSDGNLTWLDFVRVIRSVEIIICANIWHVLMLWPLLIGGDTKIAFWVQGLVAEESHMKRQSKFRYLILRVFEWVAFKCSDYYLFVSDYMRKFYESRFFKDFGASAIIIPCISDLNVRYEVRREKNRFCYLGGMAAWQRFDLAINVMNEVVSINKEAVFFIATKEVELCRTLIDAHATEDLKKVTTIQSLSSRDEIELFLSRAEYGFLIRDDVPVNNVSSPIKLAEYLSCGVTVLTTRAITSYYKSLGNAAILLDEELDFSNLKVGCPEVALSIHGQQFSVEAILPKIIYFIQNQ